MAWREALDDAASAADLDALDVQLGRARQQTLRGIAQSLDESGNAAEAARQVRALMFIERFAQDVQSRFEQLGQ